MTIKPDVNLHELIREAQTRSVLVVAHPGHELKVHGWLEIARPRVCVITDGAGRTGRSRLNSTTRVLEAAGCTTAPIYGAMSDQALYDAVLNFNHAPFINLVDEIASTLDRDEVMYVAGDAHEGYNPAHDICRLVINAAVELLNRGHGRSIRNFDFTLIWEPWECADEQNDICVRLDDAAAQRKLAAARNYPELQDEVAAALAGSGSVGLQHHPDLADRAGVKAATPSAINFDIECLRHLDGNTAACFSKESETPFYELYGERQVAAGHYQRVLRYREHMLPLAEALNSHVEKNC